MTEPAQDPAQPENQVDAAAATLARARLAAREDGFTPGMAPSNPGPGQRTRRRGSREADRRSGQSQQDHHMMGLGDVFAGLIADRGWREPVAVGSVLGRWEDLVGPEVASHTKVEAFENTRVVIACDSTAWATQLKLMEPTLRARFDQALGQGVITEISIKGPAAPSWRKGPRVVRGRGPRDTYG